MALPALVIPIATTLIGSGLSAGQAVNASKRRKEAEAAADAAAAKMRAMRFEDTMAGLQIPMMGAEQSAQKQAQREAMQIQALQEAGGAAVLGGTPGLAAMGAQEDLARMAELDQLEYARNLELARNRQAISEANINKELGIQGMELAGAQQAAAQAESEKRAAITSAASGIAQAGLDIYKTMPLYKEQQVAKELQKIGYSPSSYGPKTFDQSLAENAPKGTFFTPEAAYAPGTAFPMSPYAGLTQPKSLYAGSAFAPPTNQFTPKFLPTSDFRYNLFDQPAYNPMSAFTNPLEF